MILLFILFILSIKPVFGMDDLSEAPDSSDVEQLDLKKYTKKELINDFYDNEKIITHNKKYLVDEKFDVKNLIKQPEEKIHETNILKRKYKPKKISVCEICHKESTQYIKDSVSGKFLCHSCYMYEYRNDRSDEQNKYKKHKDNILVCESCQKEDTRYKKGKVSGKSLCQACYKYEYKYGHLIRCDNRKKHEIHDNKSLVCIKERKHYENHKDHILVCEFCQKEDIRYKKGKISGKSLCKSCYYYESRHGHLVPLNKRSKHKGHILSCEFCQKESSQYTKGQVSGKSLCRACYKYEYKYGHLIRSDNRKKHEIHNNKSFEEQKNYVNHKDHNNNQLNRLIDAELSQNENEGKIQEKTFNAKHFMEKHNRNTQIRYDDD